MVHVWSINSGERFQGHHGPLVSDESRFALSNSDGRIRVYRRRVNVTLTVVFSSGTVLVVGIP